MQLQPTNPSRPAQTIIVDADEVRSQLSKLHPTLEEDIFHEANRSGYRQRAEVTPFHAPTAAGTLHWHAFVPTMRELLVSRGWSLQDVRNCPFVLSPDKSLSLIVMTGSEDTGKAEGNPTNRAAKGAVLAESIALNQQYDLFEQQAIAYLRSTVKQGESGTQLWVLLYHVERDALGKDKEIRMELSFPSRFERNKIVDWAIRIILQPTDLGPSKADIAPIPGQPIEVPVVPRRAG